MKLTVLVISTDEAWKRSTSGELTERGFEVISQNEDNRFPQGSPDAIVFDLTDYNEAIDALVQRLIEEYPLSEWVLFFGDEGEWKHSEFVARRAFDIVPKTANIERTALIILAACTRKRKSEARLRSLKTPKS
jgi:DNA-binding NtrC family response regulator